MNRFVATAVIASLISGAAFSQQPPTNVVSSANVVGYNQIAAPSNQFFVVALDFQTTNNTIAGLFNALPVNSSVSLWDSSPAPGGQKWVTATKIRTGWSPTSMATNVLTIGSGAFVKVPNVTNIYMSGDVPMTSTTVLNTVNGFKVLSFPYPTDMPFTNTALAKGAAVNDAVSLWVSNSWSTFTKIRTGWSPTSATNIVIKVGDAVLFKATTNRVVNEVKPYSIQ